jgi:hypothetical protein
VIEEVIVGAILATSCRSFDWKCPSVCLHRWYWSGNSVFRSPERFVSARNLLKNYERRAKSGRQ